MGRGGPDVLWRIGELKFLIIECKNGVSNDSICKTDCNQLNGSVNWFKIQYDQGSCEYAPIMIHFGNVFENDCSPDQNIRIITKDKLSLLKYNILKFAQAVVSPGNFIDGDKINNLLKEFNLISKSFVDTYTTSFSIKR